MTLLVAAAEGGSLSAAGRQLHMPLATVSRKIADLETHLGARLFVRSTRRLVLTEAGRDYLASARRILEQVAEAERAAAGEYAAPRGELLVTAPVVFGRLHVVPVVTDFLAAYPEVSLRLVLADRLLDLIDDHLDVAVRIGTLPDSSLRAQRLGEMRRIVCGAPAYFAQRGVPQAPADLAGLDCITFEGVLGQMWTFRDEGGETAVPVRARFAVNGAEAAIDAAVAGAGITSVFGYQAASAVRTGALQIVLERYERAPVPVSLVSASQGIMPKKTRAFLDFAAPRLKSRLVESAIAPAV